MLVYDAILNNNEDYTYSEAIDYARGMVWNEVETLDPFLKLLEDKGYTDMVNIINNRSK